jgi:hypothetical protein
MRIDLNPAAMPELERSRGSSTGSANSSGGVDATAQTDDVANLSTGHDAVSLWERN